MKEHLLEQLAKYNQEHLLRFWDDLTESQQKQLAAQIERIDFVLIDQLYRERDVADDIRQVAEQADSPPSFCMGTGGRGVSPEQARDVARDALAHGRLGVILVAGGQGTRLGFEQPKGLYPIGPMSRKSLFQLHIEKIIAAAQRYDVRIPLYLMTSPATHDDTVAFLAEHDRFGLPEQDLHVFCQGTMPAVDAASGKVLLEGPDQIAVSPDGHGGMLAALKGSGGLDDIQARGIRHLFYFQVDNPLVDIVGLEFTGFHLASGSEMSTQVVRKQDPMERVGNVVQVNGHLQVLEYSDLPDDIARQRQEDGSLRIWAGSIAVHLFDAAFLARMTVETGALPFHIARKKVPHIDADGQRIEPQEPNAVKFERFIFDLMPSAQRAIVVEIDPAEGFAPLKNAPGAERDTPDWVRQQMMAQARRWLRAAGAEVADDVPVEISPLYALDAEELAEKVGPGMKVTESTCFE